MPKNASGKYSVEVGRIRQNIVFGDHGLEFFACGDQLLRGGQYFLSRASVAFSRALVEPYYNLYRAEQSLMEPY